MYSKTKGEIKMIMRKLLIALPANTGRETILIPTALSIIRMIKNVPIGWDYIIHVFGGLRIDAVRTDIVRFAQQEKCDAILLLDDDMSFPEDTIPKLIKHLEHGHRVISGLYCAKTYPYQLFIRPKVSGEWLKECDRKSLYPTEMVGTGCLLIDIRVFDIIAKPWFLLRYDNQMNRLITTEDCWFAQRCNDAGIVMIVDSSILCNHLKLVPFPDFFNSKFNHYDGEYWDKPEQKYSQPRNPYNGNIGISMMANTCATDGIMKCRHDLQIPVEVNKGEPQLWKCQECGLITEGMDIPFDKEQLQLELDDLEKVKFSK